ncbi:hypothetical protein DESC_880016 [Desulfosarcina cetonica]|nr:hypothetical protein DESC_880016 [Desulfosarcina cetonica]
MDSILFSRIRARSGLRCRRKLAKALRAHRNIDLQPIGRPVPMDRNADGFGHALSARVGKGFELLDAEAVKTDPPGRRIRRLNGDIQTRLGTGMLKGLNNRLVKDRLQNKRAGLGHGRAPGDPMQVCLAGKGEIFGKIAHQIENLHQIDGNHGCIDAVGKPVHLPDGGESPLNFLDDAFGAAGDHVRADRRAGLGHGRQIAEQPGRLRNDGHDVFQFMGNRGVHPSKERQAVIPE